MSAAARKMMEKMGWKDGEGLGRDKDGVKSYVKVVRRDPHTATGLGHMADPSQGGNLASTHAIELDGIYSTLVTRKGKKGNKRSRSTYSDASSSSSDGSGDKSSNVRENGRRAARSPPSASSSSSGSSSEDDEGSSDDNAAPTVAKGDVTRMSDADLFARCGGVRLGRAGRHRFFDGKLSRIATSNQSVSNGSGASSRKAGNRSSSSDSD